MNKILTGLGYFLTFGVVALQGYLVSKGVDGATAAVIVAPVAALGARLLQQATPQGRVVLPTGKRN